jgi:hypothetical protein
MRADGGVHVREFLARRAPHMARRVWTRIAAGGDIDKVQGNRNDQCCTSRQRYGEDMQHDKYEVSHLRYFARFFGFTFGVNGSGGLLSIVRSKLSVRLFASPTGRRSSLAISAARSSDVSGLCFAIVEV